MKNVFFLSLIISITSCSVFKVPSPRHTITRVMSFENMTADQIFDKTEMWFAKTFVDSRAVLELKNRDGKQLYGNGILSLDSKSYSQKFKCTFEIYIKDNQLKCNVSDIDFFHNDKYNDYNIIAFYEFIVPKAKKETEEKINSILLDLEKSIKAPVW